MNKKGSILFVCFIINIVVFVVKKKKKVFVFLFFFGNFFFLGSFVVVMRDRKSQLIRVYPTQNSIKENNTR
jgi:hypothetical protein